MIRQSHVEARRLGLRLRFVNRVTGLRNRRPEVSRRWNCTRVQAAIFERWNWLSRYSRVFARDVATGEPRRPRPRRRQRPRRRRRSLTRPCAISRSVFIECEILQRMEDPSSVTRRGIEIILGIGRLACDPCNLIRIWKRGICVLDQETSWLGEEQVGVT